MEKVTNFNDTVFAEDVIPASSKVVFSKETPVKNTPKKKTASPKTYTDFKFSYMGDEVSVKFKKNVFNKDRDGNDCWVYGLTCSADNEILISTHSFSGKPLTKNQIKNTFAHELVHYILDAGQYIDETSNEPMVEWIAKSLLMTVFNMNSEINKYFK